MYSIRLQLLVPACPHSTPIFLTAAVRKEAAARVGPRQVRATSPITAHVHCVHVLPGMRTEEFDSKVGPFVEDRVRDGQS